MRKLILAFVLSLPLMANALSLRPDSPKVYIVKPGDTLWSIAQRYLERPWEWKQLWHANPQIKNPNRLYPGAEIHLRYYKKKPYLSVTRNGTVRLSPNAEPEPLDKAIPPIPLSDIKPFLNGSQVFDQDRLSIAPYVVSYFGEHLVGGQGNIIYVKDLCRYSRPGSDDTDVEAFEFQSYAVYRPDGVYKEALTKEFLGFKARLIGYGQLVKGGDPATLVLTDIKAGVHLRDRVLPDNKPEFNLYFEPQTPTIPVSGHIIDLFGGLTQLARGQVVAIDRGLDYDLQPGVVLAVLQRGKIIKDPLNPKRNIKIPQERIGEIMIFRVFSRTSYGLIVRSIRAIKKMDVVTDP